MTCRHSAARCRERASALQQLLALVLWALPIPAGAQRVLGALEDATVAPRGTLRVSAGISFSRADERYASGRVGGLARGEIEPLGGMAFAALGPSAIEALKPLVQPLRDLSGLGTLSPSLGGLSVAIDQDVRTVPFIVEGGLTSRLMVGAVIPYVFARNDVAVLPGTGGNVGLNPALTIAAARIRNAAVLSEIAAAATRLRGRLATCQADPGAAGCSALNANRQAALNLVLQSEAAAVALSGVYGNGTAAGSRFAPLSGSALEQAIFARLGGFSSQYRTFLGLPADSVPIAARPTGAARLTTLDAAAIFADSAVGILGAPFESVEHGHLGDIELAGKLLLFDGFGGSTLRRLEPGAGLRARVAVGAAYRLANGLTVAPNAFTDIGTGDGVPDVELRGYVDIMVGDRFWQSAVVRYGMPRPDKPLVRIPDADGTGAVFPGRFREQRVERRSGSYLDAEWSPRLVLNDFFAVAANYRFRRAADDEYRGVFSVTDPAGNTRTVDAATLGASSGIEEQRVAVALTYSTVSAYARRRSGAPLELTLAFAQALSGAGVARSERVSLTARWYHKIIGANNMRR
ncbi:MAG: hypothetical protein ACT4R6_09940 [Gemmatimonadaceae bacterium]